MVGGDGNDIYIVDSSGDVTTELPGAGTDTVRASISWTLGADIERLELVGGELDGTGNVLNNTIIGTAFGNILDGGAGNDYMAGGAGDDTYIVDSASDAIAENAGAGTDTAQSSVSFILNANVERLELTGSGNINGTGNALNNTILGTAGNNIINGGAGNDYMAGGAGNDTYVVDLSSDAVAENASAGTDTVQASVSFILGANIERLELTGSGNINGNGNALNNTLLGNSGNNILNGGTGNDYMAGGLGNDYYVVDVSGDTIIENAGEGSDTVQTSGSYVLFANLERLELTDSGNINGTGNADNNTIVGNTGNNYIYGGLGNDYLVGGGGNDQFNFNTALNGTANYDIIADFDVPTDGIILENAVFTALANGFLAAGAFNTGTAATQADDRIIYNSANGTLLYDADGLGGAAGIRFAILSSGLSTLSAADFYVV